GPSTSWSLPFCSSSGFSVRTLPTTASVTVPPGLGPAWVDATPARDEIEQPGSKTRPASPARSRRTNRLGGVRKVRLDPDVGDGDDEEDSREHPRRVVDLALEAPTGSIATPQARIATTSDGSTKAGRLGRLQEHSADQQDRYDHFHDHERLADLMHRTDEVYRAL